MLIFLLGIILIALSQTGFYYLTLHLKTFKFKDLSFYFSLFITSLILFIFSSELNFTAILLWFIIIAWSFWRACYSALVLYKLKYFKSLRFNPARQLAIYKRQAVFLFLAILPLLISFSLDYKKFDYSGFSSLVLILGCFTAIAGFLLEVLFVGQKLGLKKAADDIAWEKNGIWNYQKIKAKFADYLIWTGVGCLTLSAIF